MQLVSLREGGIKLDCYLPLLKTYIFQTTILTRHPTRLFGIQLPLTTNERRRQMYTSIEGKNSIFCLHPHGIFWDPGSQDPIFLQLYILTANDNNKTPLN